MRLAVGDQGGDEVAGVLRGDGHAVEVEHLGANGESFGETSRYLFQTCFGPLRTRREFA
jgi:hypothetical protein